MYLSVFQILFKYLDSIFGQEGNMFEQQLYNNLTERHHFLQMISYGVFVIFIHMFHNLYTTCVQVVCYP